MTDVHEERGGDPGGGEETDQVPEPQVPEPQGHVAGVPYDFRKPTVARTAARWWNPDDPRLFTPKAYGAGWDINFYWLFHLVAYFRGRRARR
jgi:hypothetical protein